MPGKFPEFCYVKNGENQETVKVQYGIEGYFEVDKEKHMDPHQLNEQMGVTRRQSAAMLYGSMLGWNHPFVNPDFFNEEGQPLTSEETRKIGFLQ